VFIAISQRTFLLRPSLEKHCYSFYKTQNSALVRPQKHTAFHSIILSNYVCYVVWFPNGGHINDSLHGQKICASRSSALSEKPKNTFLNDYFHTNENFVDGNFISVFDLWTSTLKKVMFFEPARIVTYVCQICIRRFLHIWQLFSMSKLFQQWAQCCRHVHCLNCGLKANWTRLMRSRELTRA